MDTERPWLYNVVSCFVSNMDNCQVLTWRWRYEHARASDAKDCIGIFRFRNFAQTSHVFDSFFIQTRSDGFAPLRQEAISGLRERRWSGDSSRTGWISTWKLDGFGGMIDDLWVLRQNDLWGNRNRALEWRAKWLAVSMDIGMATVSK